MNHKFSFLNFLRYSRILAFIKKPPKRKTILDFGCGNGELVFYLRQEGYSAYGVDPILDYNSSLLKNDFLSLQLDQLKKNNFSIALLRFSLEHCTEPERLLQKIYNLLMPDGHIFILVPNNDFLSNHKRLSSFQRNIAAHQQTFNQEKLKNIVKGAGFCNISLKTPLCTTSLITIPCSLFKKLDPMAWLWQNQKAQKVTKIFALAFLSLLVLPITLLETIKNRGAIIELTAKKKS